MILIKRSSYYEQPDGGSLSYSETCPVEHVHEGPVCGCTTSVKEKPEGVPRHVQQRFFCPLEQYDFEFELILGHATFGQLGDPNGHGYFWYRLPKETSVQVEVTLPGYGNVDTFFTTLLQGKVEGSRLFMGHSSPRVFDPTLVDDNALYVYRSSFGGEAVRFFTSVDEIALWKNSFQLVSFIQSRVAKYAQDFVTPVEIIQKDLSSDLALLGAVAEVRRLLAPVYTNLRGTELFRLGDECYRLSSFGNVDRRAPVDERLNPR